MYSGREEELVAPLFERFTEATGTEVEVRYGDSAELAATIAEEGSNSPADVFFAQDPGSLGAVDPQLAELPEEILERVDERFRDANGRWVGTSGRTRVLVYNTDSLSDDELPSSVLELTEPEWEGRIGIAPTNASFQAFVTAMRLDLGDDETRAWLEGMKENGAKTYEKNTPIVEAVASGEIDVGLVNHYYLALVKEEQPDAPIANHLFAGDDPGALVSVAGAGVLASIDQEEDAEAIRRVPALRRRAAVLRRAGRGGRVSARRGRRAVGGSRAARRDRGARRRADRLRRRAGGDRRAPPRDRLAHLMRPLRSPRTTLVLMHHKRCHGSVDLA